MNNQKNQIAIVFPGQGSQIVGMGKDLFDNFKSARDVFEIVDDKFSYLPLNLAKILLVSGKLKLHVKNIFGVSQK